jgi:hypothetical protein
LTEALPIACSLGAGDLKRRLAAIAEIGAESLLGREADEGRHLLRFSGDAATRKRLEEIVAAEAECCSFLHLTLEERGGELVLSVAAPQDGQVVADELAAAFDGGPGMSGGESSVRGALLGGGAAVLAALCCFAGPAILGAVVGATIGGTLAIAAAVVCAAAVAVAVALLLRRRNRETGC